MSFAESLPFGKVAESAIAAWLRARKWSVLPIYEKELGTGKGPQLFMPDIELIGTDMFIFKGQVARWIEAKRKSAFSWHRITKRWTTGIDLRHYKDYCQIDAQTPWPVWLLFLHEEGQAKDTPEGMTSPTGLFGNTLAYLRDNENHRSDKWAKGMVYWAHEKLILLDTLENVHACQRERQAELAIPF